MRMTGVSNEMFCDRVGQIYSVNGTLIDGIIPTFDASQGGIWASQLYTINVAANSQCYMGKR